MKSLNLKRILTLITTCSLLAAMVVRTAPCGMERCQMQEAGMKKGCCASMAESSPRSGCDNCDCEIKSSSDTEARDAIAVPAPDIALAGPALTGETARKPSNTVLISHFPRRAPPHPGVPAYIMNASLLN